jgi:hypothetical protein
MSVDYEKKITLLFEGEVLDPRSCMQDTDIEDDDQVEVHIW